MLGCSNVYASLPITKKKITRHIISSKSTVDHRTTRRNACIAEDGRKTEVKNKYMHAQKP
jgi:hypothetical protein